MLSNCLPIIIIEDGRDTFTELYRRYESEMYHVAYSILHDKYLAEDAINDAFIKLMRYWSDIEEIESSETKTLIIMSVKSTAIDIYRKRRKQFIFETEESGKEFDEEDEMILDRIIGREEYYELMRKIKVIKKEYQDIILMKYVHGLSNSEISSILGISKDLVRQHICRAKKAMTKLLKEKK